MTGRPRFLLALWRAIEHGYAFHTSLKLAVVLDFEASNAAADAPCIFQLRHRG
jgi:hypothetical protein